MAARNSIYKQVLDKNSTNAYMGYKYHGNILENTTSRMLWKNNKFLTNFLSHIEKVITSTYESIKRIKTNLNIAHDKYDTNFN